MSAKLCLKCGKQMECIDSRATKTKYTRRRYKCKCGARKSTIEIDANLQSGRNVLKELDTALLEPYLTVIDDFTRRVATIRRRSV